MDSVMLGASQTAVAAAAQPGCACGRPDSAEFLQELDAALASARAQGRPFAVLAVALQALAASDIAACTLPSTATQLDWILGARLASACGADVVPGFLGPRRWALRLALGEPAAPAADTAASLQPQALALLDALQAPVWLCGRWMQAAVGLGLALFPGDGSDALSLLTAAQDAAAGAATQGGIRFHGAADNAPLLRQWQLGQGLQQAQARQELRLLYQPKLSLESGQIVGVQARLHWHSAEHGEVPPAEFMPLAERLGLMPELGAWCLRQACQQVLAWQQAGLRRLRVSVNISPLQWQQAELAQQVQRVLIDTGVDPASLAIELSEDSLMADLARSRQTLREFKALGVEIALKNFGTGASSLGALHALPVDVLNVDQSFVHDVTASAASVSVTRAIITMAHGMRLRVLAEGVLTEGQLGLLAAKGCDLVQGDWFSPPVPPEQISTLLQQAVVLPARFLRRREQLRTLLLVDDEDNILAALKRLLRRDGYRILTASGGEEALRCLAENRVDVIVSDQRMPGMSGVEFLRRAKALHPGTVRMTLSGFTDLQSIIDAVNEGAIYKFLTKPWDDTLLRQHVAEAFRQKELDDENKRLSMEVAHANAELEAASARLASLLQAQREQTALVAASASGAHEMLDELPVAVLGIDPDGVMAYANRAAAALLPQAHATLGSVAEEVLPALLGCQLPAGGPTVALQLGGRSYRAVTQRLEPSAAAPLGRGRLVLLIAGAEAA
jgi:EAL domain-containing protein (putative c-di-GMP-specific phosphodiesterase class I)/FixJ family two-component response regulator